MYIVHSTRTIRSRRECFDVIVNALHVYNSELMYIMLFSTYNLKRKKKITYLRFTSTIIYVKLQINDYFSLIWQLSFILICLYCMNRSLIDNNYPLIDESISLSVFLSLSLSHTIYTCFKQKRRYLIRTTNYVETIENIYITA